jgi:alkaline phosphatase
LEIEGCKDIARELFENLPGRGFNVIMGGGLSRLKPKDENAGVRRDGINLIKKWSELHPFGKYVTNRDELLNVDENVDHLLGIFSSNHMQFNADRNATVEPSLAEMTEKAIKLLKRKNSRGFLLMVEGATIDLAHHRNQAYRALDDTLALDDAVKVALKNSGKFF